MDESKNNEAIANEVIESLEEVIDPELNIDIVNLGLIYGVEVDDKGKCIITMTLTVMGCPLSDYLNDEICKMAETVDGVENCEINLVWEPAWSIEKMSRFARLSLGLA